MWAILQDKQKKDTEANAYYITAVIITWAQAANDGCTERKKRLSKDLNFIFCLLSVTNFQKYDTMVTQYRVKGNGIQFKKCTCTWTWQPVTHSSENICFQDLVCYQLNTGFLILAAMLTFSCILEFSVLKSDLLVLLGWFTGFSLVETSLTCTMKSLYSLFIALWEESHFSAIHLSS